MIFRDWMIIWKRSVYIFPDFFSCPMMNFWKSSLKQKILKSKYFSLMYCIAKFVCKPICYSPLYFRFWWIVLLFLKRKCKNYIVICIKIILNLFNVSIYNKWSDKSGEMSKNNFKQQYINVRWYHIIKSLTSMLH